MPSPAIIESILFWLLVVAGVGVWLFAFRRMQRTRELVPYEARRPVPWDAVATIPVWLWFLTGILGAMASLQPAKEPAAAPPTMTATAVANDMAAKVAICLILLALVILRSRATAADLGWQPRKIGWDTALGVAAFFAVGFIVYAVQLAFVGHDTKAKHPIIEALERDHSGALVALAFLDAVIVAPLVEEFMFRVVLQGWLEKVLGRDEPTGESDAPRSTIPALSPIVLSAAVFAALHLRFHNGVPDPDPIALFVLALGLGYLYRQTHRIWPSLVVHVLLNACSMGLVLIQIFNPAK